MTLQMWGLKSHYQPVPSLNAIWSGFPALSFLISVTPNRSQQSSSVFHSLVRFFQFARSSVFFGFNAVVVGCSTRAGGQRLLRLWQLRAQPDSRASAEDEGRLARRERGPGAGSEGDGRRPAGRTITHCDHTHKPMTICCSGHANLQYRATHNKDWRYKKAFTFMCHESTSSEGPNITVQGKVWLWHIFRTDKRLWLTFNLEAEQAVHKLEGCEFDSRPNSLSVEASCWCSRRLVRQCVMMNGYCS